MLLHRCKTCEPFLVKINHNTNQINLQHHLQFHQQLLHLFLQSLSGNVNEMYVQVTPKQAGSGSGTSTTGNKFILGWCMQVVKLVKIKIELLILGQQHIIFPHGMKASQLQKLLNIPSKCHQKYPLAGACHLKIKVVRISDDTFST